MASSLPASTQKLRPQDYDLSVIQDNLAGPIDKLLAFVNGLLNGSTTEAIKVATIAVTGAITGATVTVTGALKGASAAVTGAITGASLAVTGLVSGASATITGAISGGSAAITGALTANAVTAPTVTGSTSVVSAAGFKSIIGPYLYFSSAYAGGAVNTVFVLFNTSAATVTSVVGHAPMPFAGSIVGLGVEYFGSTTVNVTPVVKKNGSAVWSPGVVITSATTFTKGTVTAAKGTNTFAAGDELAVDVTFSATGGCGVNIFLIVEQGA